jgi:bifunctional DNase/RNase
MTAHFAQNLHTLNKLPLEILGLSASHSQSGSFALVLGEISGTRRLPIIIGMFEAQAIAIEMEKIVSNRPMTHDLFKSLAENFNINLHEIVISDLKEGVFFAKLICSDENGGNYTELDARPSDAIAIGIRFDVPIYAEESVMREAGIELSEMEGESDDTGTSSAGSGTSSRRSPVKRDIPKERSSIKNMPVEKLQGLMEKAIADEDYEEAAKIRDEIKRREEGN